MRKMSVLRRFLLWRIKHLSQRNFIMILSVVIGVLAGLGAVVIKNGVHLVKDLLTSNIVVNYQNYLFLKEFVKEKMPMVKVVEIEGTYLAWLDFRAFEIPSLELADVLKKQAKVVLNHGYEFGKSGSGFERICMA